MGLNQQQQGHQPNVYTHQTKVVVIISTQMCVYMPLNMWKYHRNWNLKFQKNDPLRNWTKDLLVVCVTKWLIPLDQRFIYKNNKSENINLIWHHLVSHRRGVHARLIFLTNYRLKIFFTKFSNTFLNSGNLYQTILKGSDQFAHIFRAWITILTKLFNFEHLYISWYQLYPNFNPM